MMSLRQKHLEKAVAFIVLISLAFYEAAIFDWHLALPAKAATSITISTDNLPNAQFNDYPIATSSSPKAIAKISIYDSIGGAQFNSVQVNFIGSSFSTTTLTALAIGTSSGVALYDDSGSGNSGSFMIGSDLIVPLNSASWNGATTTLNIASKFLTSGNNIFYLVIQTAASSTHGTQIQANFSANSIITDAGSGPASAFSPNGYMIDGLPPQVRSIEIAAPYQTDVVFSEPVQDGAVATSSYAFVGTTTVQNAVRQSPNVVRITSNAQLYEGMMISVVASNVHDYLGRSLVSSGPYGLTFAKRLKISEISAYHQSEYSEFIELYNAGSNAVDIGGLEIQRAGPFATNWWTIAQIATGTTMLPYSYYLLSTVEFDAVSAVDGNKNFSSCLWNDGSHIRIYEASTTKTYDKIGWGSAQNPEGYAAPALANTYSLERKAFGGSTMSSMATGGSDSNLGNSFDSDNNNYDYVLQASTSPQNAAAAAEQPYYSSTSNQGGSGPMIDHQPVWFMANNREATITARMGDPINGIDGVTAQLWYQLGDGTPANNTPANYTLVTGIHQTSGYFKFTIPLSVTTSCTSNGIYYYLKLVSSSGTRFLSNSAAADTAGSETLVAQNPFIAQCAAPGVEYSINGYAKNASSTAISGVYVFAKGTAVSASTTPSGYFNLTVKGGTYNVVLAKDGYYDNMRSNIQVYSSGVNIGDSVMYEGGGISGDTIRPTVKWTGPADNETGLPPNEPSFRIYAGFSKELDSATFNTSNIKLVASSDINTNLLASGATVWRPSGTGITDLNFGMIQLNGAVSTGLAPDTIYYLIFSEGIRDTSGNSLLGNRSEGGHVVTFKTRSSYVGWNDYGSGGMMPPYVEDAKPAAGSLEVPPNSKIGVKFSQPMNPSSFSPGTSIKLFRFTIVNNAEVKNSVAFSVSFDMSKRIAILTPTTSMSAGKYRLELTGALTSQDGIPMGDPNQGQNTTSFNFYTSSFEVGAATPSDNTAPTILGSYPENNASNTPVNTGAVMLQFSENLDPSTINSDTIMLKNGGSYLASDIIYDIRANSVSLIPNSVLSPSMTYSIYAIGSSTGVKDMAGNPLASTQILNFTTSSTTDSLPPQLMYANGDEYGLAITFSEPMNASKVTDTLQWPKSVLNPSNYRILYGDSGSVATSGLALPGLAGAYLTYDSMTKTLEIENVGLTSALASGKDYYIDMSTSSASDLSGNAVGSSTMKTFQMPIKNSQDTGGILGPSTSGSYNTDMASMGMMKGGAFPMNSMARQRTTYFIDVPVTRSIPVGGKIVITFPSGFDVTSAAKDAYSPINNDINGGGPGTISISSVSGVQSTQSITVTIGSSATQANDYLHMDITGIVNASIPRSYDTSGYTADIKTLDASGNLLETVSTMPFFINPAGENTLQVTVTGVTSGHNGSVPVYLGSPMTGPMKQLAYFNNATSTSVYFSYLPAGQYFVYTDPYVSLSGNDYSGLTMTETVNLASSTTVKTISLVRESAGAGKAAITIEITGSFGADNLDVFASSPSGYKVKTIESAGDNPSAILYLADGTWWIGMGPSVPKGPMSGPAPMPDWMPPAPVQLIVSGAGATTTESSGTPNDGTVSFAVGGASYQAIGYVKDGTASSAPIADAEVWAYQPGGTGGMGARAKTDATGRFVLKLARTGNYSLGAYKPGLPNVPEKGIAVAQNEAANNASDSNTSADIYLGGRLVTDASPLNIIIKKPGRTVSGKVTNGTSPVSSAPVWANRTDGSGFANAMTDASGNYILYIDAGTWNISANIPGYGNAQGQQVVVGESDIVQNLAPESGATFYTISGTVSINSALQAYRPIRAAQYNASGVYSGKQYNAQTASDGTYSISVPGSSLYRVDIWTPEYGEVGLNTDEVANNPANISVSTANVAGKDITINAGALRTISLNFVNATSSQTGFLNIDGMTFSSGIPKPNGYHQSKYISDLTAPGTISLADGDYFFFLDVPGLGKFIPDPSPSVNGRDATKDDIVVASNRQVDFTLTDISATTSVVTVSGKVYNTTAVPGQELAEAWVWVAKPATGYHNGVKSGADGSYSLTVPNGTGYKIGSSKPGYVSSDPSDLAATANATGRDFTLVPNSLVINGRIYSDANANSTYDSGEEVQGGFVRAETTDGTKKTYAPTDGSGYYELGVSSGIWKLYAVADGYVETLYTSNVTVSGSNQTANIKLTADQNWSGKSKIAPIVPASGGTLDDTASGGTGVKLVIPPNALGNSSDSGSVNANSTNSIVETNSSVPIGSGVSITAADNSGQSITNLNDYIDIEMVMYKTQVAAAISSGETTYEKLKTTNNAYWDNTANDWVVLPTTRTAYYKEAGDTEWKLFSSTSADDDFSAFIDTLPGSYSDYKLVYTSKTNHFTIFAVIMPFVALPAQADPAPGTPSPSGGSSGVIAATYCQSVTYEDWQKTCANGLQYRNVKARSPLNCLLSSAQEDGRRRSCESLAEGTEQDKTAIEGIKDAAASAIGTAGHAAIEWAKWVLRITDEAREVVRAKVDSLIALVKGKRSISAEKGTASRYLASLFSGLGRLPAASQQAIANFITYGTPTTKYLGPGERAGVLGSYKSVYQKLPSKESEWIDAIKIGNGRWPQERSVSKERQAEKEFEKIYKRSSVRKNAKDDAAVMVMAYGLRPAKRNTGSEAFAVKIFKAIYNHPPKASSEWDIVRTIAYSGATR